MMAFFCYLCQMNEKSSKSKRFIYLDAVRGIAALMVVVYHVLGSHWSWMTETKWALMLFNGADAVAIFFVLSGLVLSYKLFQTNLEITPTYYKRFVIARIFRLYPAFLVMLVIYYFYTYAAEPFGQLVGQTFLHNPHFFWEEALLMRGHHSLYLPDWTLGVEMALSLFVPFLIIIARKGDKLFMLFLLAVLLAGREYVSEFVLHFGLGILIAKNFDAIINYSSNKKWYKWRWYLFPMVFFVFSIRHFWHIHPLPGPIKYFMDSILGITEFVFSGFASAAILLYIINSKQLKVFLSTRFFKFLGEISYGVYLSHWLFTRLVMDNFDYWKGTLAQNSETKLLVIYTIFVLVGSVVSGYLIYHLIEKPFIRLGKKIAQTVSG